MTIDYFPDGSITVASIELPKVYLADSAVTPYASITGCAQSSSGTTIIRTNCKVRHSVGIMYAEFYANYRWSYYPDYQDAMVKSAQIDSVDRLRYAGVGTGTRSLQIIRKVAGAQPALARAEIDVSLAGWGGGTIFLELFVPRGGQTLAYARGDF